jgi:hypothetical protein
MVTYLRKQTFQVIETSFVGLPAAKALRYHCANRAAGAKTLTNETLGYAFFKDRIEYYIEIFNEEGLPQSIVPVFDAIVKTFEITGTADLRHALSFSAGVSRQGENRGKTRIGQGQLWTYAGKAGDSLTISIASLPLLGQYARLIVRDPSGNIIAENEGSLTLRGPWIEQLKLMETGSYEIEVYIFGDYKPSDYKLVISFGKLSTSNLL